MNKDVLLYFYIRIMGQNIQAISVAMFASSIFVNDYRALILGLDGSGKTTILYKLKLNESITTIPTIGFNVQTLTHHQAKFTLWDVGGQKTIRPLWRHYYQNTNILFFVVNSTKLDDIKQSKKQLDNVLGDEQLENVPVLIYANKMDDPNHKSVTQIVEILQLNKLRKREWFIRGCSAVTGDGLYEGLEWAAAVLRKKKK